MHALGSKDLGQKSFRSITSIITKLFIPLPSPRTPCTLCGLERVENRDSADVETGLERPG